MGPSYFIKVVASLIAILVVVEHFRRGSFRSGRAVRAIDAAAPRSLAALRSLYPKYSPPSRVPLFTHAPRHYVQHSVSIEATE
ncbi:hypothetical protein IG631_17014 [Alternaria alternata]|nr:hypothetical protein IG631_17014 [Alternaria alternata]